MHRAIVSGDRMLRVHRAAATLSSEPPNQKVDSVIPEKEVAKNRCEPHFPYRVPIQLPAFRGLAQKVPLVGNLEAAPIGKCHPMSGSTAVDQTAFVVPVDTYATRLLAQALRQYSRLGIISGMG